LCLAGINSDQLTAFWRLFSLVAPGVNPSTVKDDDPRLVDLNPSLDLRIRNKAKEVFVEEELARRR
jgi:DnaJ family protein C protein 8